MIDVEKFITNLRVNLLRSQCFYGNVLAQLPTVYDNKAVPTMGVGKNNKNEIMVKLFVNPDYIEHIIDKCDRDTKKVVDHFTEVLRHEIHHLIFEHLTMNLPDKQRQMIACELSANSYIDRNKLVPEDGSTKAGVFAEDFKLDSKLGVHEYYALLDGNKEFNKMRRNAIRQQMQKQNGGKSDEQKELDDLAQEQEQASQDTKSGKKGNGEQMEQQDGISDKTQQKMDEMQNQDSQSQNSNGKSNSQSSQSQQGKGHQKAQQKLQEARDLQDEAMNDLNNGDMDSASKKQHEASQKIQEASDAVGEDNGNGSGDGDGDSSGNPMGTLDSHDKWDSVSGDEMTNGMIKDIIRQANETCKQMGKWGDIPGEIKDAIDSAYAMDKEVVPWEVVLKDFVASSSENVLDYTMKRKSKRYDTRPGTKKDDVLNVAIGIDTSGSIDEDMLKMFFSELRWIDKTGTKMTVFEWDTQVNREYDFHDFDGTVSGRGGTDPTDFLEKVSERKFDCVITFTDLYFSNVEQKYNIPMMWVCDRGGWGYDNDDYPVSEGIIMKVNDTRDGFEVVRM